MPPKRARRGPWADEEMQPASPGEDELALMEELELERRLQEQEEELRAAVEGPVDGEA